MSCVRSELPGYTRCWFQAWAIINRMTFLITELQNARNRLLAEHQELTRLEMSKENIERVTGVKFPDDYKPVYGELVGKIFDIPVYCNDAIDGFIMIGANGKIIKAADVQR